MTGWNPTTIREKAGLEPMLEEPVAVLYKHSPLCGSSAAAAREVRAFVEENPGVPVYVVDVIRDRPVAREAARRLYVRHESPQVLVLREGEVVWSGSHGAVTAHALQRELDGSVDGADPGAAP